MRERIIYGDTPGIIYLLCFERPLGNLSNPRAQALHYLGWTDDLAARLAEHAAGHGQAITAAAVARGIAWHVFSWPGTPRRERHIKRRKELPHFCPRCCARHGWRPYAVALPAEQLVLPLLPDDDPFPAPPMRPMDGYEAWMLRQMRAARVLPVAPADNWDDGLL